MTATILVVGDVMLDEYVVGRVDRISPEAPVPVVSVAEELEHLGGAANVARQVAALGGRARLVGIVGRDDAGARVRRHCVDQGIDGSGLIEVDDRPTTTKQRIVADGQQVARLDREVSAPVDALTEGALIAAVGAAFDDDSSPDAVVLSDYAKGTLTVGLLCAVIDTARAHGRPVLVDPKSSDFARYAGATVLKANLAEFEAALGAPTGPDVAAAVAGPGRRLVEAAGIDHFVVTLGAGGLVVLPSGADEPLWIPGTARDVFDVSGAGDTVIATLALLLAAGTDIVTASVTADVAAGLGVQRPGVSVVTEAELAAELAGRSTVPPKVLDLATLVALRDRWAAEQRRVVFTNGCFDLFHVGHVHLLSAAARRGDVLVVAVDDDESVRRLKGDARPIITASERMAVIAALDGVTAVVPFATEELADVIRAVRPDVLVKGADYTASGVVGGEWVIAHGGSVELIELLPEHSTSALVDRIRGG